MAATIKHKYGIEAQLIAGAGGIFDVEANGTMVFSKHETGRFPEEQEIIDLLAPLKK